MRRLLRFPVCVTVLAATLTCVSVSVPAAAYVVRETASGVPLRWADEDISLEVDPSLVDAIPGALQAATAAGEAWTETTVGPAVQVVLATSVSTPAVDGRNVIYFIPGYPAAGSALAITLVSYDEDTGAIVDTDIVINGSYDFAVLPATDRAALGVAPVANERVSGASVTPAGSPLPFDLVHILTHETGHALGMGDDLADATDVMYLYSLPGDASRRVPTTDDEGGLADLYDGPPPSTPHACSVAVTKEPGANDASFLPLLGVLGLFACRRLPLRTNRAER